jgi:hypothetical protein
MGENARVALAIAMVIGGWGLALYAGYLHYAALPGERTRRHVTKRAFLLAAGIGLAFVGFTLLI